MEKKSLVYRISYCLGRLPGQVSKTTKSTLRRITEEVKQGLSDAKKDGTREISSSPGTTIQAEFINTD
jgi:hypothetical protein